jgi:hypothetical protein
MADSTARIAMRLVAKTKPVKPVPRQTPVTPYVPSGGVIVRAAVPISPQKERPTFRGQTLYVLPEGTPMPRPRGREIISASGEKLYDSRPSRCMCGRC